MVTVGWQQDQIFRRLPIASVWVFLGVSGVWLCTAWWVGTFRDFSTAIAFGQLIAASLSLVALHAND
jgi:hypothetical protein